MQVAHPGRPAHITESVALQATSVLLRHPAHPHQFESRNVRILAQDHQEGTARPPDRVCRVPSQGSMGAMKLFPSLRLRQAAQRHFGWRSLRPGQVDAMVPLLRGRDVMVVLPTGAGKSAIYQVPATLLHGPTLVISPLLALQHDQITSVNSRSANGRPANGGFTTTTRTTKNPPTATGKSPPTTTDSTNGGRPGNGRGTGDLRAVRVNSSQTAAQRADALQQVRTGAAKLLFITPEQLASPQRLAEVAALRPALVAVDEAHCISTWGYDFRPDYLALGHAIRALGRPPVVALTATASPPVRDDIAARLGLRNPVLVLGGLDRANLFLEAVHCPTEEHRTKRLLALIAQSPGSGIVYVPTRRAAEELAGRLVAAGVPAAHYHGGMAAGLRRSRHEDFAADRAPVMVATSAFGMGIDKPNIRFVVHAALPDSPDSYLQEVGRAGRDGAPAQAVLLYRGEDIALQRYFTGGAPDPDELERLAAVLHAGPVNKTELGRQ